jgi:hypothetical protein
VDTVITAAIVLLAVGLTGAAVGSLAVLAYWLRHHLTTGRRLEVRPGGMCENTGKTDEKK